MIGLHPPARRRGNDNDCLESQNAKGPREDSHATKRRSNLQNLQNNPCVRVDDEGAPPPNLDFKTRKRYRQRRH